MRDSLRLDIFELGQVQLVEELQQVVEDCIGNVVGIARVGMATLQRVPSHKTVFAKRDVQAPDRWLQPSLCLEVAGPTQQAAEAYRGRVATECARVSHQFIDTSPTHKKLLTSEPDAPLATDGGPYANGGVER